MSCSVYEQMPMEAKREHWIPLSLSYTHVHTYTYMYVSVSTQ